MKPPLVVLLMSTLFIGKIGCERNACWTPQYIQIGSPGIIECSFRVDVLGVLWYKLTNVSRGDAFLTWVDSVKGGEGYLSGEFDIYPNGSLLIHDVLMKYEGEYRVDVLENDDSPPKTRFITVVVFAQTFSRVPVIDNCENKTEVCFQTLNSTTGVSCTVRDARTAIPLRWIQRAGDVDRNVSSNFSIRSEFHPFFTSQVTIANTFVYERALTLLVCIANDPSGLLHKTESLALIQRSDDPLLNITPKLVFARKNSELELNCTNISISYLVWQVKQHDETVFKALLHAALVENAVHKLLKDDYKLTKQFSIVVDYVKSRHEGTYRCIGSNAFQDSVNMYEVAVFVYPDPAYPVVDGCNHQQYCVLEAHPEGTLSCTVKGIRPQVQLDIEEVFNRSPNLLQVYDKTITIENHGDTSDVLLISKYRINSVIHSRLTVECKVVGTNIKELHLSTKFDLLFRHAQPKVHGCIHYASCVLEAKRVGNLTCSIEGTHQKTHLEWKTFSEKDSLLIKFFDQQSTTTSNGDLFDVTLNSKYEVKELSVSRITLQCVTPQIDNDISGSSAKIELFFGVHSTDETTVHSKRHFLWSLMIVIPLCLVVVWILFVARGRRMGKTLTPEEGTHMSSSVTTQVESDSDPKSIFVRELKKKYKLQYDAVQPIPYIRDRLYCVERVFVEGGFEKLISKDKIEGLGNWEKLASYHDVTNFTSSSSSTRTIIEGDPGYGKSTLTLQLAYDWCNRNPTSPLAGIDILILLRLRQLGGVHSIFKAIKQFILPRDSQLEEVDIQNIIKQNKSTLFIFDGFDEYPEQEIEDLNDIITTIRGEMFQENFVVLTSRSFFLPKFYPPKTHRIRLTGFDSKARDAYIRKAVVGENIKAAEKIKRSLQKNSVLQGLCQVPLFFVMFAHMTHEGDKFLKFKSVTSFFQYMIACFHSHMRNKMEDKNVRKINVHETDHDRLDEVAFEGLSGKNQKIVWRKKDLIQRLGKEFYNQYRAIGILIEEEVLDISDRPVDTYYETEVRFYHKLFCEWYAAHYLCRKVLEEKVDLSELLQHMNPFDLQYTYRFACGINANAGDKIIEYLRGIKDGDKFAVLCILEQSGKFDQIKNIVEDMCSNFITINNTDNMLLQGSIVQLLEIGSNNKIPVSFLWLKDCFNSIDLSTGQILLKSELSIPVLPTLIELAIGDNRREVTNEEFAATVEYSSMCSALRSLRFCHLLMPKVLDERCLSVVQGCNLQVLWITDDDEFLLNNKSGKWQKSDQRSSKNVFEGNSPAKENLFISLAKRKYDELIRAVQKMPSYLNKQVNEYQIYTEGTLEFLMSKGSKKSTDSWVPLQSYKDMFTDNKVKSKRRVLIGKRGFGKSTLALQMADDWSHGNSTSPLPKFDIFILVTLHPTEQIFESIYKHIKHNVIPKGSPLCCNDIKSLLLYTSSVLLVLDGFDFQPDCANDSKFDIFDILQGKILKNIDVISMCANEPSVCAPGTKFLRLMGFNEETQCEYIRKNVTGNDVVASDEVKQKLHDNPILADLSHIPMFLVFFAQLVHENNVFQAIQTFTCFFHNLMKRFFSCMRNNDGDVDAQNCQLCEGNHTVIGKIAFEGLCNKNYDGIWRKEEICKKVGKDFYEHFLRTGILVEESSESQMFAGNLSVDKNDRQVRFYHRLFMEWFAAHHIAMCAEDFSEEKLNEYLQSVSPLEQQFMYLFACGLGQAAADNIIRCIKQNNKESNIEMLCKIEQGGGVEAIRQDLTNLCSRTISFDQNKSKLLTRNTIQLVRIASIHNISISCVWLNKCYSTVDLRGGNHLQLKSNLSIPVLTTLNELMIDTGDEGREITSEEFTGILQYSSKCLALKELTLRGCLLPPSVQTDCVSVLRSRNVKVLWDPRRPPTFLVAKYQMNLQSGCWEHRDYSRKGEQITDEDYQSEVREFRQHTR